MLIQLPSYAQLEEDAMGQYTLLNLLDQIYRFNLDLETVRARGERQYHRLDDWAQRDPRLKEAIAKLEAVYDSEVAAASTPQTPRPEEVPDLAPEIERFLRDVEQRGDGEDR